MENDRESPASKARPVNTGADSFSTFERRFVGPGRRLFMRVLGPLAALLAALHVTPNAVSAGQLALGVLFIALAGSRPRLALLLFLLALVLDALDGVLARRTGRMSPFGALFDQFCDHARETMVIGGLAAIGALAPLPAVLYAFTYAAFNFVIYLCNYYRTPLPVAVKSYFIVYPAIFLFLWSGLNWLTWAVILGLAAMGIVILIGLARLRVAMGGTHRSQ